jgi:hypothetical protein
MSRRKKREAMRENYKCTDCGGYATDRDVASMEWAQKEDDARVKLGYLNIFKGKALCSTCLLKPEEDLPPMESGANDRGRNGARATEDTVYGDNYHDSIRFTAEENRRWNENLTALKDRLSERVKQV